MKGNRNNNMEQRGPLGTTLPRKMTTTLPVVAPQHNGARFESILFTITKNNLMDTTYPPIIFQPMTMSRISKRALLLFDVHTTPHHTTPHHTTPHHTTPHHTTPHHTTIMKD
jgi:hypothetical protein